ncbi:DNA polymerase III subunit beta [Patescibacteria group bacterium]|nr:DNA polymerase III subunit beta [Patescibacteria group bacterium]MBU1500616.1 DNA polymerase III subunit beta [Patescibacteria group bacterium]MBU2080541.1 DNA polymerase III subunit beta [Patescibacteria group bacterium]MBU2123654.1 DNA polymerase III subunit beta [Patescibacteria group bacterium]MBU2194510.1 DNA polymerase III subunit beta [Patescibacteria group bacterium]
MIITLDKKEFMEGVGSVSRFAERRTGTLPVLAGIAIIAGDDGIKLRATNLETGIDLKVNGKIQETGVVALPANTLREIAASFSGGGTITLEHAGETVVVSTGGARSTLKTLPFEDFPTLPLPEAPQAKFTLSGATLKSLVTSVMNYASTSSVRPELASVLLAAEGGSIKAVATDSFRLAEKKISLKATIPPFTMLIPAKNAADIMQTLPDEDIEIQVDDHQGAFFWSTGVLTTRLVSANYPDYTQIIPKSFIADATLLKKDFEAALKRTAIFSDSFLKVRLEFDASGKKVSLSAQNADVGDSSETVSGSVSGESVQLSFNHRYLSAPLSGLASDSITLSASGIGRAMVLRGSGDTSFLYLVMPMNQ